MSLVPIYVVVLLDALGFTLILPLLPTYAEHFGASAFEASLLFSVYSLCQLVAVPWLGRLSDRIGRKTVLLVSQLGTLISFVMMARADALWILFVARAIDGVTAGNTAVAMAIVSDRVAPAERTRAFALVTTCYSIGFFIGPSLVAAIVPYGLSAPIWAAAGFCAVNVVGTALVVRAPAPVHARPSKSAWSDLKILVARPELKSLFSAHTASAFAVWWFASGFALFAERRLRWGDRPYGVREIGIANATLALTTVVVQLLLIKRLVQRWGDRRLVFFGLFCLVTGHVVCATGPIAPVVLGAIALAGFGLAIVRPALSSLISRAAGPADQGLALGAQQSITSASQIAAPILGGLILQRGLVASWALVAAAMSTVAALAISTDRVREDVTNP